MRKSVYFRFLHQILIAFWQCIEAKYSQDHDFMDFIAISEILHGPLQGNYYQQPHKALIVEGCFVIQPPSGRKCQCFDHLASIIPFLGNFFPSWGETGHDLPLCKCPQAVIFLAVVSSLLPIPLAETQWITWITVDTTVNWLC